MEERCDRSEGYDIPPFASMSDFKIWEDVEPPQGHCLQLLRSGRGTIDSTNIAGYPAPPEIAVQIYNRGTIPTMLAKLQSGQSIKQVDRLGEGTSWKASSADASAGRPFTGGMAGAPLTRCP